jgi:hypothetical protein
MWKFSLFIVLVLSVFCLGAAGQTEDGVTLAKIIKSSKPDIPPEAKQTGLGGKVSVDVTIDENGKAASAENVTGPGWVCPSVERQDVLALRSAAKVAALKTQFSPATKNGTPIKSILRLNFQFPQTPINVPHVKGNFKRVDEYNAETKTAEGVPDGLTISGGVLTGSAMSLPKPPYPPAARAVRATGSVKIEVLIDVDGTVFSAEGVTGHPLLIGAARTAACKATFVPTQLEGKPVKILGIITYNFVP